MKIEIEWNCSYEATITIDGRKLKVKARPGEVTLSGMKPGESENTLGGMIAIGIYSKVADAMQAEATVLEEMGLNVTPTWKRLPEHVAEAVYDRIA